MRIDRALAWGRAELDAAGVETAHLDARLLLQYASGLSAEDIIAAPERVLTGEGASRFDACIARRREGEPVAYIVGHKEFWGLAFETPDGVLIPRPDSETLIEAALEMFERAAPLRILDLGTGTGCLLIALLSEFPHATGVGLDASAIAAACAGANARRLGVAERAHFRNDDWSGSVEGVFDLVISNPPYIAPDEEAALPRDVRCFEPREALVADDEGLAAYKEIVNVARRSLTANGRLMLEIGASQALAVTLILSQAGCYRDIRVKPDLGGRSRCIVARFSPANNN